MGEAPRVPPRGPCPGSGCRRGVRLHRAAPPGAAAVPHRRLRCPERPGRADLGGPRPVPPPRTTGTVRVLYWGRPRTRRPSLDRGRPLRPAGRVRPGGQLRDPGRHRQGRFRLGGAWVPSRIGVPGPTPASSTGSRRRTSWHIGVAPLVDDEFNGAKSAIKALDYAALGLAVVASGCPGLPPHRQTARDRAARREPAGGVARGPSMPDRRCRAPASSGDQRPRGAFGGALASARAKLWAQRPAVAPRLETPGEGAQPRSGSGGVLSGSRARPRPTAPRLCRPGRSAAASSPRGACCTSTSRTGNAPARPSRRSPWGAEHAMGLAVLPGYLHSYVEGMPPRTTRAGGEHVEREFAFTSCNPWRLRAVATDQIVEELKPEVERPPASTSPPTPSPSGISPASPAVAATAMDRQWAAARWQHCTWPDLHDFMWNAGDVRPRHPDRGWSDLSGTALIRAYAAHGTPVDGAARALPPGRGSRPRAARTSRLLAWATAGI